MLNKRLKKKLLFMITIIKMQHKLSQIYSDLNNSIEKLESINGSYLYLGYNKLR